MMDPYLIVILLAMMPVFECMGAIAVGILILHLNPLAVFVLAFAFNVLVFFPVYGLLEFVYKGHLDKVGGIRRVVEGIRVKGKRVIDKYGFWGLTVYLAIPIPLSGTWTGTGIAWLLGIKKRRALLAITIGVFVAAVFVTVLSLFAAEVLYWLGAPTKSPF
jgi:uncharacterized membrane protein